MIELLLAVAMIPVMLPAVSLLILTLAALGSRQNQTDDVVDSGTMPVRTAVLVPAHNESANVLPTIESLKSQLGPLDLLLVIADNCDDDTAELARLAGATVIERSSSTLRGKGYALAFGVDHLRADPPEVVLVVDADCVLSEGAVNRIAQCCRATKKPVQILNLMSAGSGADIKLRVLEFAMLVNNLVRPMGTFRLGGACHLKGTGMAFPWRLMATAKLATGHITEDMKLGVELAMAGSAPQFLPQVRVSSSFPLDTGVAKVQKTRWEHGHLATIAEELPSLLAAAIKSGKPAVIVMAMDLLIPPTALYLLVLCATAIVSFTAAVYWPVWYIAVMLVSIAATCFGLAVGLAWFRFGRHLLTARELIATPLYALWKVPVYLAYFLKKRSGWVRTKRDSE